MPNRNSIVGAKRSNTTTATPTAFRVSVHAKSQTETIKLRFDVVGPDSTQASLYAIQRFRQMHPAHEVYYLRSTPKNK